MSLCLGLKASYTVAVTTCLKNKMEIIDRFHHQQINVLHQEINSTLLSEP